MTEPLLARIAALKTAPIPDLKPQWRDLFDTEPPPYNRTFLESRLAYRIQELAYGGLSRRRIERLENMADDLDGGNQAAPQDGAGPAHRRHPADPRMAGRRALRDRARRRLSNIRAGRTSPCRRWRAPSPAPAGMA